VSRQRELHQEAVDLRIPVQPVHDLEQLGLAGALGQPDGLGVHPGFLARLALGLHVDLARRILSDDHHGQARLPTLAGVLFRGLRHLRANGVGQRYSVEDACAHRA
jgi:hypothetical protein